MTDLRELLASARCVLFDFDGPVCRLFARHRASDVAAEITASLSSRFEHGDPRRRPELFDDPLALLVEVYGQGESASIVAEWEQRLTEQEIWAAATAQETEHANLLIKALSAAGFRLAVTTNNSPSAVTAYLRREGLEACFGEHVHGRTSDPKLLKPHPYCLEQALESTGSTAGESLMIGDSPGDWQAATNIGVRFLGFAPRLAKRVSLQRAAVDEIILSSLQPLCDAVGSGPQIER
ncbi:HAD family hydrolase [Streptomyces noboritoensis]|uniref:HAD family hydrolase n=1 Tax=Streptomyces noboritoensis TaxID=67337 RepID=A0ABV6TP43_9ACTN